MTEKTTTTTKTTITAQSPPKEKKIVEIKPKLPTPFLPPLVASTATESPSKKEPKIVDSSDLFSENIKQQSANELINVNAQKVC